MTTYVILGHGGFNPEAEQYPPEILVPRDTTMKFWSDAGQVLMLPATTLEGGRGSDYAKVAPMFNQLKAAQPSLGPTTQTYNWKLYPDNIEAERKAARAADWGGAELIMIETGNTWLCMDTEKKCPTPATLSDPTATEDPSRYEHQCQGILGQYGGKGNEIHWVACTSFQIATPELPSLVTAAATGPGLKLDPNWEPNDKALKQASDLNQKNVKATAPGGNIAVAAGGKMVLIGARHDDDHGNYVGRQPDKEEGVITVTKASAFKKGAGTLEVKGITTKYQGAVKDALNEFSDKEVVFV
jgi:Putative adhesin Stv domain